jgi:hypothetical protein
VAPAIRVRSLAVQRRAPVVLDADPLLLVAEVDPEPLDAPLVGHGQLRLGRGKLGVVQQESHVRLLAALGQWGGHRDQLPGLPYAA